MSKFSDFLQIENDSKFEKLFLRFKFDESVRIFKNYIFLLIVLYNFKWN